MSNLPTSKTKQRQDFSNVRPSGFATVSTLLALGWLLITFLQEDPYIFVVLGGLNLLTTVFSRYVSLRNIGQEIEGEIFGYMVVWVLAFFFYTLKEEVLVVLDISFQVKEALILFLIVTFLAWFVIRPTDTVQEIIFGLPPFLSNVVLNLWMLSVIFLFLVTFIQELRFLSDYAFWFFIIVGFFELIVFYFRQYRIDYEDLILNPFSVVGSILAGPAQATKWIILPVIFILLDMLNFGFSTGLLMVFAIFVGIISLITNITNLTLSSGVIESRVEEGKTFVPQILEEVKVMSSEESLTQFDEFYEVERKTRLSKKRDVITFNKEDLIIYLPFSEVLEEKTGLFIFQINKQKLIGQAKRSWDEKEHQPDSKKTSSMDDPQSQEEAFKEEMSKLVKNLNLTGSAFHRLNKDKWKELKENLKKIEKESFATTLGFKDSEELDQVLIKTAQNSVKVQEHIRSRIMGIPAPNFQVNFVTVIKDNSFDLPSDLLKDMKIENGQEIEIIPGKSDYLFYVKRK